MKFLRFSDLCASGQARGQRVFIRADLNVPQDDQGAITEDTRIRASLPCIQLALDAGAAVLVTSHLGRPTEGEFKPAGQPGPGGPAHGRTAGPQICSEWCPAGVQLGGWGAGRPRPARHAGKRAPEQGREKEQRRAEQKDGRPVRHLRARRLRHRPPRRSQHLRHRPVRQDGLRRPAPGRRDGRHQPGFEPTEAPAGGHRRRLQGQHQAHHPQEPGGTTSTS